MSPQDIERLATLEEAQRHMREDLAEIRVMLEKLLGIANMGRGALWLVIRIGGFAGLLASVFEAIRLAGRH